MNISKQLLAHLASEVTTLACCWQIKLLNGKVMGFTDCDQDLSIDDYQYLAASGFTASAIVNNSNLAVDNLEIEGMLSNEHINEQDLLAGLYDHAEIWVFLVNYQDLAQGKIILRHGWLGEISLNKSNFVCEIRGLSQKLQQNIGELYSPNCRAQFSDKRCGLDMNKFTKSGVIEGVIAGTHLVDSSRKEVADYFSQGVIRILSGNNKGFSRQIIKYVVGNVYLPIPFPYQINKGDQYSITAGCDKKIFSCEGKFNNVINFRGEPHIPGSDNVLSTNYTKN